jgi:hypothetical protein
MVQPNPFMINVLGASSQQLSRPNQIGTLTVQDVSAPVTINIATNGRLPEVRPAPSLEGARDTT